MGSRPAGEPGSFDAGSAEGVAGKDEGGGATGGRAGGREAGFGVGGEGLAEFPAVEVGGGGCGGQQRRGSFEEEAGDFFAGGVEVVAGEGRGGVDGDGGGAGGEAFGGVIGEPGDGAIGGAEVAGRGDGGGAFEGGEKGEAGVVVDGFEDGADGSGERSVTGIEQGERLGHGGGEDEGAGLVRFAGLEFDAPCAAGRVDAFDGGADVEIEAAGEKSGDAVHAAGGVVAGVASVGEPGGDEAGVLPAADGFGEAGVADGEELGAVIEEAAVEGAGGETAAGAAAFIDEGDGEAALTEHGRGGEA